MNPDHVRIAASLVFEAAAIGLTVAIIVYARIKR